MPYRVDNIEEIKLLEVFDSGELIPWIRTFICRITEIEFSNKELEKQFKRDMEGIYKLYDI